MDLVLYLKKKGYRLTAARQEILKVLGSLSYPISVQDLHSILLQEGVSVDLASVYRSMELFVQMGLVYVIDLGEETKRYELVNEQNHHHHLVCTKCGVVKDITVNESAMTNEAQQKSDFKIDHHHLEFFGLCKQCQQT